MCNENQTVVTELVLTGFQNTYKTKVILFCFILLVHLCTVIGNLLIIFLVSSSHILRRPMYLFLSNLALADLIVSSSIVPNMLCIIWLDGHTMTINGCATQYFFVFVSTYAQCCLLMIMSFDRYLAICLPLRYSSIMSTNFSLRLVILAWLIGMLLIKVELILIGQLQFCTSNIIDHFFCDFAPLLALSSSEVTVYELAQLDFSFNIFVIFLPFVCITISYICIFFVILNIASVSGKKKALSTCSSHLIVVCTYYGSLITVYMAPARASSLYENKFRSLLFVMLTPFTNPIVYSLRNKDIKDALSKLFCNRQSK
ncbi:olfactory receptor 5V1-like [Hyperolius riggenbachi]|uniref:olfactory receptor 5V1-like n=1 Tax=Hyperolius riggenbachi TaxID=752182 RepID=UPI0035A2758B